MHVHCIKTGGPPGPGESLLLLTVDHAVLTAPRQSATSCSTSTAPFRSTAWRSRFRSATGSRACPAYPSQSRARPPRPSQSSTTRILPAGSTTSRRALGPPAALQSPARQGRRYPGAPGPRPCRRARAPSRSARGLADGRRSDIWSRRRVEMAQDVLSLWRRREPITRHGSTNVWYELGDSVVMGIRRLSCVCILEVIPIHLRSRRPSKRPTKLCGSPVIHRLSCAYWELRRAGRGIPFKINTKLLHTMMGSKDQWSAALPPLFRSNRRNSETRLSIVSLCLPAVRHGIVLCC